MGDLKKSIKNYIHIEIATHKMIEDPTEQVRNRTQAVPGTHKH